MEGYEAMIMNFFNKYGWQLTVIAAAGIFILGVLKFFNLFDKVDKSKRKYVYASVSGGLSIIAAAVYLIIYDGFSWTVFGLLAPSIYFINQSVYNAYENMGIRPAVKKIGMLIGKTIISHIFIEDSRTEIEREEDEKDKVNVDTDTSNENITNQIIEE